MHTFKAFVKKEFLHIFRDVRTLVILFGMPVVQVTLFGFAITDEVNHAPLAIFDKSRDYVTREISDRLFASGYFQPAAYVESDEQLEEAFKQGRVKMGVVFENNFAKKLSTGESPAIQFIADGSDPNIASTMVAYASAIVNSSGEFGDPKAAQFRIIPETSMLYNPALDSAYYFVPGVITVLMMLISAMMTSIAIAREKEMGNMEVLLVSPVKPVTIIVGKSIPYVALALADALIILAIGAIVFRMPLEGNLMLLLFELLLFVATSLALGIFISTAANNQQTAMMMSLMGLMLPTILLSGFIFPVESMPAILQALSNIIPARWFIIIIKDIMLKGVGWEIVWKETLILTGMLFVFIALSIKNFKTRLA